MSPILSQLGAVAGGPVPEAVRTGIPSRIIDIVGIAVRASSLDTSRSVVGFAADQGSAPQATPIGGGQAMSAAEASWQEHRITLQHVDAQIKRANRRV